VEEAGDPERGEFIRLQCDLARLPADDPRRPALTVRETELLAANRDRWRVPGLRGQQGFRRGFVEVLSTAAEWLLDAGTTAALAPIRVLRLAGANDRLADLARSPVFAHVESLELRNNNLPAGRLERFLTTAPLDRLTSLSLGNCRLWTDHLEGLARSPVAARLTRLDVSGNPIGDGGAALLADAPAFAGLAELLAPSNHLDYENCIHGIGAYRLAESGTLKRLRVLDLERHYVGDAGLIDLITSPNAANLEELNLGYNALGPLGESAFESLAASPHLGNLRRLSLAGAEVNGLAAAAIAGWPRLADGLRIDLRGAELFDSARATLLASPFAGQFRFDE
jgi:hypothetical protein